LSKEKLRHDNLVKNLLLAQGGEGHSAWHLAVVNGEVNLVENIWEWAKWKQTAEEINNKLLLARIYGNPTSWLSAISNGSVQLLEKLCEWAEDKLTREELRNKLLLAIDISSAEPPCITQRRVEIYRY
jgi:hypothetical protein